MIEPLYSDKFDFISVQDKNFIIAFDDEMRKIGYTCSDTIGPGYCWGKYMIIYLKAGAKNKRVVARIYIRENDITLRLFLNKIDEHREYIENQPLYIQEPFMGDIGKCRRCKNDRDGYCKFRKSYTINNIYIEKCNGSTFEYQSPDMEKLPGYISLLKEFYLLKRR